MRRRPSSSRRRWTRGRRTRTRTPAPNPSPAGPPRRHTPPSNPSKSLAASLMADLAWAACSVATRTASPPSRAHRRASCPPEASTCTPPPNPPPLPYPTWPTASTSTIPLSRLCYGTSRRWASPRIKSKNTPASSRATWSSTRPRPRSRRRRRSEQVGHRRLLRLWPISAHNTPAPRAAQPNEAHLLPLRLRDEAPPRRGRPLPLPARQGPHLRLVHASEPPLLLRTPASSPRTSAPLHLCPIATAPAAMLPPPDLRPLRGLQRLPSTMKPRSPRRLTPAALQSHHPSPETGFPQPPPVLPLLLPPAPVSHPLLHRETR